jgi:two-component system, sensor histidine kinase PdtaS
MKKNLFSFFYFILYLGVLVTSNNLWSQTKNLEKELNKISFYLNSYEPDIVIFKVDSLLRENKFSNITNTYFILQESKSQALIQAELYDEAFIIIKKTLNDKNIPLAHITKLLNQLALIYELILDFKNCKLILDECEQIYKKNRIKKDEEYGVLLYRKSSYYRLLNQDSLSLKFANLSNSFAKANDFKNVEAVSNMLLGFLCKPDEHSKRLNLLNKSLEYWKKTNDKHGISNTYISIGKVYLTNRNYQLNLVYCDSAFRVAKETNFLSTISYVCLSKSNAFELLKNNDSALYYYKKHNEYSELKNSFIKELKIKEQENNFLLRQEEIKNNFIHNENERIKKNYRVLLLLVTVLLLSMVALLFQFKKIKKQNEIVNNQKKIISISNKELSKNINEKQLLLKELHHRVKNNLSLISSLISFQSDSIEEENIKSKFNDLQNRIIAISLAHERLFINENNKLSEEYNLNEFINAISNAQLNLDARKIQFNSKINAVFLNVNSAVPLGILINELISNSIKHAKFRGEFLIIDITINKINNSIIIEYEDNGIGFKTNPNKSTLGLFIIENMIRQINGTFERENSKYTIKIKL